jgi:hypothetical protein
MPSNEPYYYAAYAISAIVYLVYGVSLHLRRHALRRRDARR